MANPMSDARLVRTSASIAHAFLRDQVLAVLAPVFFVQHCRAIVEPAREIADVRTCGLNSEIDPQPTGIGRS